MFSSRCILYCTETLGLYLSVSTVLYSVHRDIRPICLCLLYCTCTQRHQTYKFVSTVLYMYTETLDLQVCVYCTVHVHRDIRPISLCVYCTVHVHRDIRPICLCLLYCTCTQRYQTYKSVSTVLYMYTETLDLYVSVSTVLYMSGAQLEVKLCAIKELRRGVWGTPKAPIRSRADTLVGGPEGRSPPEGQRFQQLKMAIPVVKSLLFLPSRFIHASVDRTLQEVNIYEQRKYEVQQHLLKKKCLDS